MHAGILSNYPSRSQVKGVYSIIIFILICLYLFKSLKHSFALSFQLFPSMIYNKVSELIAWLNKRTGFNASWSQF